MCPGKVYIDENRRQHWPILFLYENEGQTDYLIDCSEDILIRDIYSTLYSWDQEPAPWNIDRKYNDMSIEFYVTIIDNSNNKIDIVLRPDQSLSHNLRYLCSKGYKVPIIPIFYIRLQEGF